MLTEIDVWLTAGAVVVLFVGGLYLHSWLEDRRKRWP